MARSPVSLLLSHFGYQLLVDKATMASANAGGENLTETDHCWVLELVEAMSADAGSDVDASVADAGQNKAFADWKHWHSCCCRNVHDQTYPWIYLEEGSYSFHVPVPVYETSVHQYWHFHLLVPERDSVGRC